MNLDLARAVRRRSLFALGIGVIWLGIYTHPCAAEPPATAFGKYLGSGCPPKVKANACLPTKATDRVSILRDKETDAKASVRIVFDKGHICALEGGAVWSDDHFTLRADGLDPSQPCQLALRINGSALTLEDVGGFCRQVYCGTRGTFDGARFKKRP
ncbi:MAG: hypothetical protein F9K25_13990 [Candidatus Contendobacter sp.]|nr:MAG: hypothetical protein F9K25_13990 [Candidatus Contendobacter sp.]